jgi:hypothetical protein
MDQQNVPPKKMAEYVQLVKTIRGLRVFRDSRKMTPGKRQATTTRHCRLSLNTR